MHLSDAAVEQCINIVDRDTSVLEPLKSGVLEPQTQGKSRPLAREPSRLISVGVVDSQQWEALMADVLTGAPAKTSKHGLIASDRVEGTPVRNRKGDKIGSIERLMIDKKSGRVAYGVLSFGGFLGMGNKHFPIPWKSLDYDPEAEAYVVNISDQKLKDAPSFEDKAQFDWGDRSQEISLHNYYGAGPYWGI